LLASVAVIAILNPGHLPFVTVLGVYLERGPVPTFERSRGAVDTIKGQVAELFNLHVMNLSM
jgi:hypothetical protein